MKNRSRSWNIDENNFKEEDFKEALAKLKKIKGVYYAYCYHIQEETPHYHLVCVFINAISFDSMKNKFPRAHIEATIDLAKSIQYLTHKNEPEKVQYKYEDIITNNNDKTYSLYEETYSTCYIDDDCELYSDLKKGLDLSQIITSEKYSLSYLNKRLSVIKEAVSIYYHKRIEDNAFKRCINNLYYNQLIPFDAESSIFKVIQEERKDIEILNNLENVILK